MSILKNAAIKGVTKKRTRQFTTLIEQGINSDQFQEKDMSERVFHILTTLVNTIDMAINFQEGSGSLNIDTKSVDNWKELLFLIVVQSVRSELSYDPTMGEDKDFDLIEEVFNRELDSWNKSLKKQLMCH